MLIVYKIPKLFKKIYDRTYITENRSKDMNINPVSVHGQYAQKDTNKNSRQGSSDVGENNSLAEESTEESLRYSVIIEVKKLHQRKQDEFDQLQRDLIAARQSANDFGESFEIKIKCLRIAARITSGDEVSPKDTKFLAKHDPQMLAMAQMRRIEKENPKKKGDITDEEDAEEQSTADAVSTASEAAEIPQQQIETSPEATEA